MLGKTNQEEEWRVADVKYAESSVLMETLESRDTTREGALRKVIK